jgi:hypothetical protein
MRQYVQHQQQEQQHQQEQGQQQQQLHRASSCALPIPAAADEVAKSLGGPSGGLAGWLYRMKSCLL